MTSERGQVTNGDEEDEESDEGDSVLHSLAAAADLVKNGYDRTAENADDQQDDVTAEAATNVASTELTSQTSSQPSSSSTSAYKSRKPKWWKNLGPGRPSKGQKKAMAALQATHQLHRIPYGNFYDWNEIFFSKSREEAAATAIAERNNSNNRLPWLEIGCGTGENLLALAERHSSTSLIGAEMHPSGIGKCFQRIHQATLRQRFWRGQHALYSVALEQECQTNLRQSQQNPYLIAMNQANEEYNDESNYSGVTVEPTNTIEGPYPNVRLFAGNGVTVLEKSPTASLDVVLITFPDPFPKHPEYRLLQDDVLQQIHRALVPARGRLVVATDHDGHAQWVQAQLLKRQKQQASCAWKRIGTTTELRAFYLPAVSKYEAKGWSEGRTTKVLIYERTGTSDV